MLDEPLSRFEREGYSPGPAEPDRAREYFEAVADARYVIRRVMRIADEQAKEVGDLEPLEHQALIQVCGARHGVIRVNELANRLNIVAAFASRLITTLEDRGLVVRSPDDKDKRVVLVSVSRPGVELLARIDERVRAHVGIFRARLTREQRRAALQVFVFYVGTEDESP